MKNFLETLFSAFIGIGIIVIALAWLVSFINVTFGISFWSVTWCKEMLINLLSMFK